MSARIEDQRSVSTDADMGQEGKASIERPRSLSSKIAGLFAVAVALLFIATAFSPLASAQGIDLVAKDASLKDVKIDSVLKLDAKEIMNKVSSGEPMSLRVNGSSMSFALKEGTLLAPNFRVLLPDGTLLQRSDGITIPRFFSGASPEGDAVSLTVVGEWMRFSVNTNDSSYSIDAYDGTGASGYYAAYRSGPSPASVADVVDDKKSTVRNESMYRVAEPLDNDTAASNAREAAAESSIGTQDLEASVNSGTEQVTFASDMSLQTSYSNEHSTVLVDIYPVADYAYTSLYSNWADRIYSEIWNVHGHYESQAGISFNVVGLAQLNASTCTSSDAYTLWTQFKSYLNNRSAYPTSSDWDVAHLFSGKTLNPGNGNYCTYSSGAGIAILRNDPATFESYGCSISQQNYVGNNENEWLLGHCIGLSLNADHAYAGSSSDWMWPIWNTLSTLNMNSNDVNRIQTFAQQVCDRSKLINFGGSEHWINLYVTNMVMITTDVPTVGNSVTFGFTIYNTASTSIDLDVLVVGGRDAYGNVKDFGQRTNVHINASGGSPFEYWFTSSTGFESGGTWTIFASALENGQYSPYEWLALHPTVYYCLNSWHRTSTLPEFSSNDLFHQWGIYATSPYVGPGSEIMVSFTLFSKAGGTGYTNYNWIFVMVNDPNDAWKDFGGVSNVVLTNGGNNGILGGGLHEKVTTTLDGPSGVWKIGPSYQIAGQDWGPWMAPLYIDVGFIDIKYSDLIIPHTWDQDTTYVISTWVLAPTFGDPSVSFIKVGMAIAIHTFTSVTGRPSMEVAIATYYNDPYTPYGGSYNIYNNQPRDVSVYINKTTFNSGVYGTTYGNPYFDGVDPKTKSGVDILDGQQETYSYGYGMAYPTYTSPDPYIYAGDIAMVAIGALVSGLPGIAISAGWLCTSALVQLTSTQTDNPHDVGFTSGGSSAYAHWDRANLPFHDPYGYDRFYWTYENNVSTVNYAFLEIADDEGTTGWDNVSHGKFSFQFQCMYKYSFKGGVNGQQNDRFVTTSPLYICISP